MGSITLLTVIGARPQFIKAAAVSREVRERDDIIETLVHTGQHFDPNMSDVFFDELDIPKPHYHLGFGGGSHGAMTGRMLEGIEKIILEGKPDFVLVYGDTNSTLAGALAAVKLHVPIAHVEAGLRSFNRRMPEEINRILTDHAADILFSPTITASRNLQNEGISPSHIHQVGDVMYDAALYYRARSKRPEWWQDIPENYVLATIHRAENVDDPNRLSKIFKGIEASGRNVILPVHPRTRKALAERGQTIPANIKVVDPVGYLEMIWLIDNCDMVLTDSGGLQKEAYFFEKLCLTMRDETEWVETVEAGWNVLVGSNRDKICQEIQHRSPMRGLQPNLYGNGNAAKKILDTLIDEANILQ